jgi:hypothetical protein
LQRMYLFSAQAAATFSLNKDGGVFNDTMYIPFALSCKNALRIKHRDNERVYSSPSKLCIRKIASVFVAKNMYPLKKKEKLSLDLLKQQFQYFISFFATEYTDANAKD